MPSNLPTDKSRHQSVRGCLYVVATPIGNMDDITVRALNTLKEADLVAAEDTRHTGKLMTRHQIRTPLISYHEHNEKKRTPSLVNRLNNGESIALVTDAGTPSVSDPGYRLVKASVENHIRVVPVPGVSAAVAALSISGLPTDTFVFAGFPDRRKGKRLHQLSLLAEEKKTLIFYESPRRLIGFLAEIRESMGDRQAVLCREMTKLYEEFVRGSVSEIIHTLEQRQHIKGECTLVVAGAGDNEPMSLDELRNEIRAALQTPGSRPSHVSKTIAEKCGFSRSRVYAEVLKVKNEATNASHPPRDSSCAGK